MTDATRELRETARLVVLGLAVVAAVDFVGSWLHERATGAAAVQLAIAEFGAGKLGIAWSPADTVAPTTRSIALRAARGAGFGFAAAIVMWLVGMATKAIAFRIVPPAFAEIAVGLLVAVLLGARDELLLRGLVLRITGTWWKGWPVLAACAAAAVARGWSADNATPNGAIVAACAAIALGCIWLVDRGAWMAVGANAAFTFASHVLGIGSGRPAAIAMGAIAAAAVVWWRVRRNPG